MSNEQQTPWDWAEDELLKPEVSPSPAKIIERACRDYAASEAAKAKCPHLRSSAEGTQWCELAEASVAQRTVERDRFKDILDRGVLTEWRETERKLRDELAKCQREMDELRQEYYDVVNQRNQFQKAMVQSQRACAEMRAVLTDPTRLTVTGGVVIAGYDLQKALATDAGRSYVPLADVEPLVEALKEALDEARERDEDLGANCWPQVQSALEAWRKAHGV